MFFSDNTSSANEELTWSIDNSALASISEEGTFTPMAASTVNVTAQFESVKGELTIVIGSEAHSRLEAVQAFSVLPSKITTVFKVFDDNDAPVTGLAETGTDKWRSNFLVSEFNSETGVKKEGIDTSVDHRALLDNIIIRTIP